MIEEYLFKNLQRSVHEQESLRASLVRQLELPEVESVTVERLSLIHISEPTRPY